MILSAGSFILGTRQASEKVVTITKEADGTENVSTENRDKTDVIAVVNTDTGVYSNGEQINYGTRLLPALNDNFTAANLEAARTGVENGTYAAYIVIPSTFSQSVVSLNSTPTQTELEYAIGANLEEESRVRAIYDVLGFEETMNNNMRQMYLRSILSAYHTAQDDASTIMANDTADTNNLLSIQATDLTQLITMPELARVDKSVSPLDVSRYNDQSKAAIEEINHSYSYFISLSQEDVKLLQEEGNALAEQLTTDGNKVVSQVTSLQENVNNMNLTTVMINGEPHYVYQDGVDALNNSFADYNLKTLDNAETSAKGSLSSADSTMSTAAANLRTAIANYENAITKYNHETLSNGKKDAAEAIWNDITTDIPVSYDNTSDTISVDDQAVPITYFVGGSTPTAVDEATMNADMAILSAYIVDIDALINDPAITDLAALQTAYADYLATTNPDAAALRDNIALNGAETVATIDKDTLAADIHTAISAEIAERYPGKEDLQTNFINQYITDFSDSSFDKTVTGIDIVDDLDKGSTTAGTASTTLSIPRMDTDALAQTVDDDIVNPLIEQADSQKSTVAAQAAETNKNTIDLNSSASSAISSYQRTVSSYNPLTNIDNAAIQVYLSELQSGNTEIQSTVMQNYQDNMQYVTDVYTNAETNVSALQQSIMTANETANQNITNSLASVQAAKESTSSTNQTMLSSFAASLPYTRLGNLEYTRAYEFISNPVGLNQIAANTTARIKDSAKVTPTSSTQTETVNKGTLPTRILYIILGILVLIGIIAVVMTMAKGKKKDNLNHIA